MRKLNLTVYELIKFHFYDLDVLWKWLGIQEDIIFSSLFISLFTSLAQLDNSYLLDFWDVILQEHWRGGMKCILFIIQTYEEELLHMNYNKTLKFFTSLKQSPEIIDKLNQNSLKSFLKEFRFNDEIFDYHLSNQ